MWVLTTGGLRIKRCRKPVKVHNSLATGGEASINSVRLRLVFVSIVRFVAPPHAARLIRNW